MILCLAKKEDNKIGAQIIGNLMPRKKNSRNCYEKMSQGSNFFRIIVHDGNEVGEGIDLDVY